MSVVATIDEALTDREARHVVPLSGGKDSTALAVYMSQEYPELDVEYVTADTGVELPESYEYFERLEHVLGKKIVRVSALDALGVEERNGRTAFDVVLYEYFSGFLPGPASRWCTRELKIKPYERYLGEGKAYSYIAIRADENRSGYINKAKPVMLSSQPNIVPVYPFKDDGMALADVTRLLEDSGLGLPDYYEWRSRSGCFFCFYQQLAEWQGLKERHPDLFEKAKGYEQGQNGRAFSWVQGRTLDQVENMPRKRMKPKSDDDGCAICHL